MSFKIHLIIVGFIIAAVYLAWSLIAPQTGPAPQAMQHQASPYSIIIVHASWGLNCNYQEFAPKTESDGFASTNNNANISLREDNVLIKVSDLCNGKLQCTIPVTSEVLGTDASANCMDKELAVEYRCFSYDRPWAIKSMGPALEISCDKPRKD